MLLLFLLSYLTLTFGFNLEVRKSNVWEFSDPTPDAKSFFGYQVKLHQGAAGPRLVTSAPQNTGNSPVGAVFSCELKKNGKCESLTTAKENSIQDQATIDKQNANQWLGMTLSQADDDSLMVCAPLWHTQFFEGETKNNVAYMGRCGLIDKDLKTNAYTINVCESVKEKLSNTQYAYCEAGFSSTGDANKDFRAYYIGAPGSISFQGRIFAIVEDLSKTNPPVQFNSSDTKLKGESNTLMGYSITTGNFDEGSPFKGIVAGAPRANFLKGIVIMYTVQRNPDGLIFKTSYNNPDGQVGSYYGASVCALDLNNDGKDDLLVGAPHFSKVNDEGKVYIYMNEKGVGLDRQKEGLQPEKKAGARFGETITNIGDLNKDGYLDVAISAPGGGPDGRGAVYIYNGAANGLRTQYSQMIAASDYIEPTSSGFGSSISNGLDVDKNEYVDITIGSYRSSKAFIFRSRPIVTLSDSLETNITQVPPEANMTNCVGPGGNDYHCIELKINLKYNGKGDFDKFDVELTLDLDPAKTIRKRSFVLNPVTNKLQSTFVKNVTLSKDKTSPISTVVYVLVTGAVDLFAPVQLSTKYKAFESLTGVCGSGTCPIVNIYGTRSGVHKITYLKRCGSDDTCHTDLSIEKLTYRLPKNKQQKEIVYGSVYELDVFAKLKNSGETSYQTQLQLNYSSDLQIGSVVVDGKSQAPFKIEPANDTIDTLSFLMLNPVNQDQTVDVIIKFTVTKRRPSAEIYTFDLAASGIGEDTNLENNNASLEIPTKIETCVEVSGDVVPATVLYNETKSQPTDEITSVEQLGPEVNFTFYVQNSGRLPVTGLLTEIDILIEKQNEALIYVVDLMVDDVRCNPVINKLNSNNYKVPKVIQPKVTDGIDIKTRTRRDANIENSKQNAKNVLKCEDGTCRTFSCNIKKIPKGQGSKVFAVTRIWAANLAKLNLGSKTIETRMNVKFTGDDRSNNVQKEGCALSALVTLKAGPRASKLESRVDWWIILLAVLGALILLAICAAVLYRLGFFKRQKKVPEIKHPDEMQAKESLSRADEDDEDSE